MTKKIICYCFFVTVFMVAVVAALALIVVGDICYRKPICQEKVLKYQKRFEQVCRDYNAKPITIMTDDDIALAALLITRKQAQRTILLCHGFSYNKEKMAHFIDLFPDDHVMLFDFRAHGNSGGHFISFGYHEKNDIQTITDFLCKHDATKNMPLVGLGCSMGAAALLAASAHGCSFDALIIDSSFAQLYDQIVHVFKRKTGLPHIPFMFFAQKWFNYLGNCDLDTIIPGNYARQITCPVLVIHSDDDEFTPVDHAHTIYQNLGWKKDLWIASKVPHAQLGNYCLQEYKNRVYKFLYKNGI